MNIFKIFQDIETIDPEMYDRLNSRRGLFKKASNLGLKLSAAAVPFILGGVLNEARGENKDAITDTLNFALTLEYLESEFYNLSVTNGTTAKGNNKTTFDQIAKHEMDHVTLLKSVLKSSAVSKPTFDFTAKGKFNPTDYPTFLVLSQAFEDTGVRAYKGQAPNLLGTDTLTVALQIHSVEARHAAMVRKIRMQSSWITGNNSSDAANPIIGSSYAGEDNITQAGINVTTLGYSAAVATEAFDEYLTKDQVLAIAGQFIV